MFESIILGMVQGIAEWLPISSEAMIVLVQSHFFHNGQSFSDMISFAIFLHTGTLLAAVVYYRSKIRGLMSDMTRYRHLNQEKKSIIQFLCIATVVSGVLGIILLQVVTYTQSLFADQKTITLLVALFLMITAYTLYRAEMHKKQTSEKLTKKRAVITGIVQGFAAIPGISRSGGTVAAMGLLGISKEQALELSFLLSIPLVFFANIILNAPVFLAMTAYHAIALASAFVWGIITIELLLRIVKKVRFSYFVALFSLLLYIVSVLFL